MNEDRELMDFVKGRLEEGVSPEAPRMAEIVRAATAESFALTAESRSRRRLWVASFAAASLAVVCCLPIFNYMHSSEPENTVACVIDLLRTADGVESGETNETTVAEMFLAWQDAPYESAIADL